MAGLRRDRGSFLAAVFFAFGTMCGILTGKCASAAMAASTVERTVGFFGDSILASGILAAMAAPLLLLLLSMTLFGAFLILPCVMLAGGAVGWTLCCFLRCGIPEAVIDPMLLCALLPQVPCLILIAASCMRLSASLRTMVTGGLRRPDLSAELLTMAAAFFVKLMTALLFAMLLRRQGTL